jgi:triphosphatase
MLPVQPHGTSAVEIEAKFRVDDDTFPQLLRLSAIGNFRLVAASRIEDQHNVYFDTADGRLRAGGYGLRVRDLGDRRIATLKGATRLRDGTHERDEWEATIDDDDRPEAWPTGELRDRVLALLDGSPLQPILTIHTLRRHMFAEQQGARVAELSLDESTISAGGRTIHFRELEIELLETGARPDFDALVGLLRERFRLIPEERTKLQRGHALLDQSNDNREQ